LADDAATIERLQARAAEAAAGLAAHAKSAVDARATAIALSAENAELRRADSTCRAVIRAAPCAKSCAAHMHVDRLAPWLTLGI
jgi:hypothetical protein